MGIQTTLNIKRSEAEEKFVNKLLDFTSFICDVFNPKLAFIPEKMPLNLIFSVKNSKHYL